MSRTRNNNRVQHHTPDHEGRTRQEFAAEADINNIMGKWRVQGYVEDVQLGTPVYADFTTEMDYLAAQNAIVEADALFNSLPARVRRAVDNEPGKLIAYLQDPDNAEELVQLGLKLPVKDTVVEPYTENQNTPPGHYPPLPKPAPEASTGETAVSSPTPESHHEKTS